MKANRLVIAVVVFAGIALRMAGQQSEPDLKLLAEIRTNAERGDAQFQAVLGVVFFYGNLGVTKDYFEAVKWYKMSAEQGNALAQNNLAACYTGGQGVTKDLSEAVKWYCKAAEQNFAPAQASLGFCYANGEGVTKDGVEAVKWYRRAAEQNRAEAQYNLGWCYANGEGVAEDAAEAVKWYRIAAEQNFAPAQCNLGFCYANGVGVAKNAAEAVNWFSKAAEQNDAVAQYNLGVHYGSGDGVVKDEIACYKWMLLARAQGLEAAKQQIAISESRLTRDEVVEGQRRARNFRPRSFSSSAGYKSNTGITQIRPASSGTGFFISEDGYLISNHHVVEGANQVRLVTSAGLISAKVVKVDAANDLALLKTELPWQAPETDPIVKSNTAPWAVIIKNKVVRNFSVLPVLTSRSVNLGATVATVGFPNIGLQGFAPKLAKGEIAALSGAADDARYFQISVPVQPGNSGGALVDERGNVVGVVSAKLNASVALALSGTLPENVNYAVKSSYLLSFLESVPDVVSKLKEAQTKDKKFEDVVKEAEQAAVLVLVY